MLVNQNVKVRLAQHIRYAEELKYDAIYGSIYGAQNYGLDTEESDVDSYLIVMPSLEDVAMNKPLKSVDLSYKVDDVDTGERIVIKDIRLFMKNILNGDLMLLKLSILNILFAIKQLTRNILQLFEK